MFEINEEEKSIFVTRGDAVIFSVSAEGERILEDGTVEKEAFKFRAGDTITFRVYAKKNCTDVVLEKIFNVENEAEEYWIYISGDYTKFDEVISKPKDYWYEVVLNEDTIPQTFIGYDNNGAKQFRIFPEGEEVNA